MSFYTLIQVTLNVGLMKLRKGFTPVEGEEKFGDLSSGSGHSSTATGVDL